jgi:hypothetical protein
MEADNDAKLTDAQPLLWMATTYAPGITGGNDAKPTDAEPLP